MATLYAVIGKPVDHSLSPELYAAAFGALGMDASMIRLSPPIKSGEEVPAALKAAGVSGAAVTLPYKEGAAKACAALTDEAALASAVNSIRFGEDGPEGHNTDLIGIRKSLDELEFNPAQKRCAIVGAGGAARAAATVLLLGGATQIDLLGRTLARSADLIINFERKFPKCSFRAVPIDSRLAKEALRYADILINASPAGMRGVADSFPFNPSGLKPSAVVFDIVYTPDPTALIVEARRMGHRAIAGRRMFLEQMLAQFEFLTGAKAPIEAVEQTLSGALK